MKKGVKKKELNINPNLPTRSQKPKPLPHRKAVDDVVFDIPGLIQAERDRVYWAVGELVRSRLGNAYTLKSR